MDIATARRSHGFRAPPPPAAKERREQVVHAHAAKDIVDIDIARATGPSAVP
ncbi:MAG: hypothetical protein ACLS3M_02165 [Collinsella sp.]